MSAKRIEVMVDVLDHPNQRALPLANLTAGEFIAAILQEFRDIEYVGIDPSDYRLLRSDNGEVNPDHELGAELAAPVAATAVRAADAAGDSNPEAALPHLRLVECVRKTPPNAQPAAARLYLREEATGRVYRLAWLPAIIGRSDPAVLADALVAANLEPLPTGLRVSRRHIRIVEAGTHLYAECLSNNPASVRRAGGVTIPLGRTRQEIVSGDVLYLDRAEIALKFIAI